MSKQKVIIIGAGLAGSLLSLYLAKRGVKTDIYEARADMRLEEMSAGRSINLALSDRGIAALKDVGMDQYMLSEAVPMLGRMIHTVGGETKLLPYSGREGEYINSVSRGGLNIALINEADNFPESTFHFDQRCIDFDCQTGEALIENAVTGEKFKVEGDTAIATDGAGSAIRQAMMNGGVPRFNYQQKFLDHGYKELHIPPVEAKDNKENQHLSTASGSDLVSHNKSVLNPAGDTNALHLFRMEKNALHIWARGEFLMIALPNFDGSFTCTLFLAFEGETSFQQLTDEASLMKFFKTYFPDAIPQMPMLAHDFFSNPTGSLGTVKCLPWNVEGKALLIGDSAHAMVPFYGQGMNCAFEDCRVFDKLIDKHGTEWEKIFEEYTSLRKPNADAICDLAEENFYEMRDAVADPVFQKKRELETRLEQTFPDYFSKYSLVTFREDVPYSEAKKRGNAQDDLLMNICADTDDVSEIVLSDVFERIKQI